MMFFAESNKIKEEPLDSDSEGVSMELVCWQLKEEDCEGIFDIDEKDPLLGAEICLPSASDGDVGDSSATQRIENQQLKPGPIQSPIPDEPPLLKADKSHKGAEIFNCDLCGYQCKRKWDLAQHLKQHMNEKLILCDICGQSFNIQSNLRAHKKIHSPDVPLSCAICEKQFKLQCNLNKHMRTHSDHMAYSCEICGRKFKFTSNLNAHMRGVHSNEKQQNPCWICKKNFSSKSSLKKHIKLHTGEGVSTCSICHKDFSSKQSLLVHMRAHQNHPYSCTKCRKKFSQKEGLESHNKNECRGLGKFCCSVCGNRYQTKNALKKHSQKKHERNSPADAHTGSSSTDGSMSWREKQQSGEEESIDSKPGVVIENLVECIPKEEKSECDQDHNREILDACGMPACSSGTRSGSDITGATYSTTRLALDDSLMDSCETMIEIKEEMDYIKTESEITEYALYLSQCEAERKKQLSE
ncbi:hypothetical protein QAD02_006642 [Eretmocerus hayati]|uniref:Uncharacterized protein n=1 Tax=Eretmocerus hayati TaxID=131215 RepID=A0ACC2N5Q0_9HYME|nr:hypothetical protein QAD02_006642 [Eretmocerus hayati]